MARKISGPRKRRTRQHVIAALAVHHVEGFILEEGHTAERIDYDYGFDLLMRTFDRRGYAEPGGLFFQVKATEQLETSRGSVHGDLDIRDYNLWMHEKTTVILIVYDAVLRKAYWQDIQAYFSDATRKPEAGAKWVRVNIPAGQTLSRDAIAELRRRKNGVENDRRILDAES